MALVEDNNDDVVMKEGGGLHVGDGLCVIDAERVDEAEASPISKAASLRPYSSSMCAWTTSWW